MGRFRKPHPAALIGAGLLAWASPARASDVAEIGCPLASLAEADRAALAASIAAAPTAPEETSGILQRGLDQCLRRFEWTRAEYADAYVFARASLATALFRGRLEGRGLDLSWLEREVLGDSALIAAVTEVRISVAESNALFDRLEPELRPWADRHSGEPLVTEALGGFVAMTAAAEGARIRFSRH